MVSSTLLGLPAEGKAASGPALHALDGPVIGRTRVASGEDSRIEKSPRLLSEAGGSLRSARIERG